MGYNVNQISIYMFFMNGKCSWTGLKMLDINSLCLWIFKKMFGLRYWWFSSSLGKKKHGIRSRYRVWFCYYLNIGGSILWCGLAKENEGRRALQHNNVPSVGILKIFVTIIFFLYFFFFFKPEIKYLWIIGEDNSCVFHFLWCLFPAVGVRNISYILGRWGWGKRMRL